MIGGKKKFARMFFEKNVLLKITIRDLNKTLLSKEANEIYSEIYQIIHQGNNGYLI